MNKMNKKGFTLIEMLVVIAIIAILVAIIIPTVTSATDKAAAATNAANLRSIKAEVTTAYLTNDTTKYTFTETKDASGKVTGITVALKSGKTFAEELPTAKKCGDVAADTGMSITFNLSTNDFTVTFGTDRDIEYFSDYAEGNK